MAPKLPRGEDVLRLSESAPVRRIVQAEAIGWLDTNAAQPGTSVVTSLPDITEVPELDFEGWRSWFIDTARRVIRWLPSDGVAIFFQSDVRHAGAWIDKGYFVLRAADDERASIVWHKIVCRRPPGTIALGRASYSHMICASKGVRNPPMHPGPDVLADAGHMPWKKAMGESACRVACRYLKDDTATQRVVDPFCGHGTVLAMANAFGFDAIGVDRSARQCKAARRLVVHG